MQVLNKVTLTFARRDITIHIATKMLVIIPWTFSKVTEEKYHETIDNRSKTVPFLFAKGVKVRNITQEHYAPERWETKHP